MAQIPGVAQVQVFGGTPHAVRIELDTAALAAKGLTPTDVSNALRAANVTSPQGTLSNGRTQMTVFANDGLQKPEEFARLLIASKNGTAGAAVRRGEGLRRPAGQVPGCLVQRQ